MVHIFLYDTTLRDGCQCEGISISCNDKLKIARKLDEFGIQYIEGGNALECYEQVLEQDPANGDALNGLAQIEARYVELATQAIAQGQPQKAQQYLAGLRLVNPESLALAELESRLQAPAQVAIMTTPPPTVAPTLRPEPTNTPMPTATPTSKPTEKPITTPTPKAISCWDAPEAGKTCTEPVTGMEFVYVPQGCFQMGQTETDKQQIINAFDEKKYNKDFTNELPRHQVCVDGFWMGKHEITNAQYRKFKTDRPNYEYRGRSFNGDMQPVTQ